MDKIPTIHAVAPEIRAGRVSPVELVAACLARVDRLEERIHAWVLVDRTGAHAEAARLADEVRHGHWRGPLHGIPVGVKDIIDVFDWPTAAGSRSWAQSIARRDATVVERLRNAGAVILGKTVTTPFASFDPSPTSNPWSLERTPGGSSSGSAAAVALGMCLAALGSQTGGSITRPASYCGVAGCKPTFGRVSTDGFVPLAPSMDHPGPIAGCVRDLAILLQTIAGLDLRDLACSTRAVPEWIAPLEREVPAPRLGRVRGLFEQLAGPVVSGMLETVLQKLGNCGATITEVALPAAFADVIPKHRLVMAVEAAQFHKSRLARHADDYPPNIRALLEEGFLASAIEYAQCKEHQTQLSQQILPLFAGVDGLITPATTDAAPGAATTGNPAFNSPWSYTGLPTVSIPTGLSPEGLPLAIQLVGRPWAEAEVFAAAAWCEEVLGVGRLEPPV